MPYEVQRVATDHDDSFDFAEWGTAERIVDLDDSSVSVTRLDFGLEPAPKHYVHWLSR